MARVELLEDPDLRISLAALVALLDRGFGRPAPAVSGATDMPTLTLQHLVAARTFSAELAAERSAVDANGSQAGEAAGPPSDGTHQPGPSYPEILVALQASLTPQQLVDFLDKAKLSHRMTITLGDGSARGITSSAQAWSSRLRRWANASMRCGREADRGCPLTFSQQPR
jgi:hypothetical protein